MTTIGDGNWLLAYSHIAHDCVVGNGTTFSNNAQLAGHVVIEDYAVLGGFVGVHQFCRVGAHAMRRRRIDRAAGRPAVRDRARVIRPSREAPTARACAAADSAAPTSLPSSARTRPCIAAGSRSNDALEQNRRRGASRCRRSGCSPHFWRPRARDHPLRRAVMAAETRRPRSRSASSPAKRRATRWGAELIRAVRQRIPGVRFAGIGGPRMESCRLRDLVSACQARAARLRRGTDPSAAVWCASARDVYPPPALDASAPLFIGVDAPDFNLGLEATPQARRRAHDALCQPVGLGVAAQAHRHHRALGRSSAGAVSVRAAALRRMPASG